MEQLLVLEFLGTMKGFWKNQQLWIRQNVLEVLNQVPSETSATGKGTVKRKYHYSYLDIGFVDTSDNKPQCVICGKMLPNSSMFASKTAQSF